MSFLKRKNVTLSPKVYFVKAMGSMAMGLFASLLIGTIFSTLGKYAGVLAASESAANFPGFVLWILTKGGSFFSQVGTWASSAAGCAIGVAIAYSLEAPNLVLLSAAAVGAAGYGLGGTFIVDGVEKTLTAGPAGAFVAVLIAVELGKLVSKETKVDILVTPSVTILSGLLIAKLVCPYIAWAMYYFGNFINYTTELHPIIMGIIIAALIGIALTLPISSAAICAMISISGLAGGAALAGCCAHMVGYAFLSYRENRAGGLLAQGLGTSMLQMGNLVKKPLLWIPAILISVITGPLATTVFKLRCEGVSAGMGTCGLVGPIGGLTAPGEKGALYYIGIVVICFVLPALLGIVFSKFFRKIGMIKNGDLKLDL
ncbi:MAG: PTS sugar transporter subunit IIC [Clostridia bacterium]|nr:PTS sugar transporter subunit IIC [Clostridia bacterium]